MSNNECTSARYIMRNGSVFSVWADESMIEAARKLGFTEVADEHGTPISGGAAIGSGEKLKIEVGKRYICRNGEITPPVDRDDISHFCKWPLGWVSRYFESGRTNPNTESEYDIIQPAPAASEGKCDCDVATMPGCVVPAPQQEAGRLPRPTLLKVLHLGWELHRIFQEPCADGREVMRHFAPTDFEGDDLYCINGLLKDEDVEWNGKPGPAKFAIKAKIMQWLGSFDDSQSDTQAELERLRSQLADEKEMHVTVVSDLQSQLSQVQGEAERVKADLKRYRSADSSPSFYLIQHEFELICKLVGMPSDSAPSHVFEQIERKLKPQPPAPAEAREFVVGCVVECVDDDACTKIREYGRYRVSKVQHGFNGRIFVSVDHENDSYDAARFKIITPASPAVGAEDCPFEHINCGACGCAIQKDGGCNCEDNRKHCTRRDSYSEALKEIARLRKCTTNEIPTMQELESQVATLTEELRKIGVILQHVEKVENPGRNCLVDALNRIQSVIDHDGRYDGKPEVFSTKEAAQAAGNTEGN